MMYRRVLFVSLMILGFIFFSTADRLPNQTPENQVFSIDTMIEVTGAVEDMNTLKWVIASPGAIPADIPGYSQIVAESTYEDSILTNGGKLSENRNFAYDSGDMGEKQYNLETEKVLTYAGTEGAHLVGDEEYIFSIAGNWAATENQIRCVFSSGPLMVPAFCNRISAKSGLVNMNSAQVSTKGFLRTVSGSLNDPMEMSYRIAVDPDENSGNEFAEGSVHTDFAVRVMESRDYNDYRNGSDDSDLSGSNTWNRTASEIQWKDTTSVTGAIRNFRKVFGDPSYQSGLRYSFGYPLVSGGTVASAVAVPVGIPHTKPSPLPGLPGTGTVTVNAMYLGFPPAITGVPFTLTGPKGGTGNTPQTFTNMPFGTYTATPGNNIIVISTPGTGTLSTAGSTLSLVMT